jgi:large subunit ribosomal protein L25
VTAVPEAIDADVSGLQIGDVLRVGDLKAPSGANILDDVEASVVSVIAPIVEPVAVAVEAPEVAVEAGAEGAGAAETSEGGEEA